MPLDKVLAIYIEVTSGPAIRRRSRSNLPDGNCAEDVVTSRLDVVEVILLEISHGGFDLVDRVASDVLKELGKARELVKENGSYTGISSVMVKNC